MARIWFRGAPPISEGGGPTPYFSPQTPNHKAPPLCTFGYPRISPPPWLRPWEGPRLYGLVDQTRQTISGLGPSSWKSAAAQQRKRPRSSAFLSIAISFPRNLHLIRTLVSPRTIQPSLSKRGHANLPATSSSPLIAPRRRVTCIQKSRTISRRGGPAIPCRKMRRSILDRILRERTLPFIASHFNSFSSELRL